MSRPAKPDLNKSLLPRASKSLGQNFLVDKRVAERIVAALGPLESSTVVEIGPGRGALTESLLKTAGRLVAIEFDRNLVPLLTERFGQHEKFTLVQDDALEVDFCALIQPSTRAQVVANLPYNIGTAIVQRLLEQRRCLGGMVLMLQREVVDRMTAEPGSKERGYLSVLVQAYSEVERLFDVAPGAFRPAPKIWSGVVRLTPKAAIEGPVKDEESFLRLVSAGFAQRRKTILNNLRSAPSPLQETIKAHGGASIVLCQAEVGLQRRAETLTLEEWIRIHRVISGGEKTIH
jgi:16S rRNA (adenine1518-N6/adenine1519-N6)-dimethyltransferase